MDTLKVIVTTRSCHYWIDLNDIFFLQGDGSYSIFYLRDGRTIKASKNLKNCMADFPENDIFFQTHRSWIVNKNMIKSVVYHKYWLLQLVDHREVPIIRSKLKELYTLLKESGRKFKGKTMDDKRVEGIEVLEQVLPKANTMTLISPKNIPEDNYIITPQLSQISI